MFVNRGEGYFLYENFSDSKEVEETLGEFYVCIATRLFRSHEHLRSFQPTKKDDKIKETYIQMKVFITVLYC